MDIALFRNEIQKHTDSFIFNIESFCRVGFDYDKARAVSDTSGFPIFGLADNLYYKSRYQEGYLEWMVRDQLVNELLNYLFKAYDYDIRWRLNDSCLTTSGFRNKENEEKFPIEFFIIQDGKTTAFQYTLFASDYSIPMNLPDDLLWAYHKIGVKNIDNWVSIDWTGLSRQEILKKYRALKKYEPFQTVISLKDLFEQYFSDEEYDLLLSGICDAVKQANVLLGFQTIPRLVPGNLAVFKDDVLKELSSTEFDRLVYQAVDKNGKPSTTCSDGVLESDDYLELNGNFEGQSRYLALTGVSKFATSFITSEYLFGIFKSGTAFDYTSVVCGYIKSIEQLCETIIYDALLPRHDKNLFIKTVWLEKVELRVLNELGVLKKVDDYNYISMEEENSKYFDRKLTMGQMFYFFDVNKERIFNIDPIKSEPKIYECMKNYLNFDRNGYFHKHNINDFNVAKRIRNNTLLILYWLLGATLLTGDASGDLSLLGVVDDSFDRLYKKIAYQHCFRYLIKLNDGTEHKVVRILLKTVSSGFDENGYLKDAKLTFTEVEQYPDDYFEYYSFVDTLPESKELIVIDRTNIPLEIYMVDANGDKNIIRF